MTPEQALFTFARRYCLERGETWARQYFALQRARAQTDERPTQQEVDAETRVWVLRIILCDIETLDFDALPPLPELTDLLELASAATEQGSRPRAVSTAEVEERDRFTDSVRDEAQHPNLNIAPLFYRRLLSADESQRLWPKLRAKWGIDADRQCWYPIHDVKTHPSLLAFKLREIDAEALQQAIRQFFTDRGITRIWELRERYAGGDCRIDTGVEDLHHNPFEGYWFSDDNDWIVYCSHEHTITLGGAITEIAPPNPITDYWASFLPPER